eukprot:6202004-Pleurochrysis_carterae.AAC.2
MPASRMRCPLQGNKAYPMSKSSLTAHSKSSGSGQTRNAVTSESEARRVAHASIAAGTCAALRATSQ